jgi:hypothetical protein
MLWVERVTDLDAIREELAVYNQLLPGEGDLAATLLIELREEARMREELRQLVGLDRHLALLVGERRIPAVFEDGRQTEEKISAVQYVRFPVDGATRDALRAGAPLAIAVDHPNYAAQAALDDAARAAVVGSFFDPRVADADLHRVRDGAS